MVSQLSDSTLQALLIEDNLEYAEMLRLLLAGGAAPAIKLTHVPLLGEALRCLSDGAFDVVLLDLSLPDSQGFDTFTRVHNHVPHLPIVVITALKDENLALRAVRETPTVERVINNLLVRGEDDLGASSSDDLDVKPA